MTLGNCFRDLGLQHEAFDQKAFARVYPKWQESVSRLSVIQGHDYALPSLALVALIHRSALVHWPSGQSGQSLPAIQSNERLEFLGDSLVGIFLSAELMSRHPTLSEGELTRARGSLASARSLATKARELGLGECLFMGKGERLSGGGLKESLLADAFEAITAALFLDAGQEKAWTWLREIFDRDLSAAVSNHVQRDPKSALQEWMQAATGQAPEYRLLEQTPDSSGLGVESFRMGAFAAGQELARGEGRSKAEASRRAASAVLARIESGELGFLAKSAQERSDQSTPREKVALEQRNREEAR